jgi:hypothetical protein
VTAGRRRGVPWRSAEVWAREFVAAFGDQGLTVADVKHIAAKDKRLRERVPSAVLALTRQTSRVVGVPVLQWIAMARHRPGLLTVKAHTARRQMLAIRSLLGLSSAAARQRVKTEPSLVFYGTGVLQQRMEDLRLITGLSATDWRRCVRRCPKLITAKPETFRRLVNGQRRVLALSATEHGALVMREPRLLVRSPEAMRVFLKEMVSSWGLTAPEARALVLRAPSLVCSGRAALLGQHLDALAKGFDVEKARIVVAVKSFPPLAYQNPARLLAAVHTGAASLGVDVSTVMEAGLRSPSLLARRPEHWGRRMRLVIRIARTLDYDLTATEALEKFPAALTYGSERLLQRYAMARLGIWAINWMALLSLSDQRARAMLTAHFVTHEEREGMREALIKRELL